MGALGLDQLTDDQLLELVQEMCSELVKRDPYVRNLAQQTITTEVERITLRRKCAQAAIQAALADYAVQVRKETFADVKRLVADGSIRLLTPDEEADLALRAEEEAKAQLKQDLEDSLFRKQNPAASHFKPPPVAPYTQSGGTFSVTARMPYGPDPSGKAAYPRVYPRK